MKREIRYIVIKIEDTEHLTYQQQVQLDEVLQTINKGRERIGKKKSEYVVVGSDWPMYEETWQKIEQWVDGIEPPK